MAGIGVRIVPGKFGDNARRAADRTPKETRQLVSKIVIIAQSEIQDETPTGAFGFLKGSYDTQVQQRGNTTRGAVINPQPYHDPVEDGRRPGRRPPTAALVPWVAVRLGVPIEFRQAVAFLVARAIGARGTEGAQMVESGWEATRTRVRPMLRKSGFEIVRELRR